MDLFQAMRAFVTTVNAGSMSAAAEHLGITSAMVGQHVAALEARLGTRLLNRTTRRQHLTDFGAAYYEQSKDILARVALSDQQAEIQKNEARGTLRITAPTTFGIACLMPSLAKYRETAPKVDVDVILTDRRVDLVEEGIDIAFRIGKLSDSRIIQRKLMPYTMQACASPSYLERNGTAKHPHDLVDHELISFSSNAGNGLKLHKDGEQVEVLPRTRVGVNSGHGLLAAAKAGLGVIVQPKILVEPAIAAGELIPLLPNWHFNERYVSLLYYRDKTMTPRLRSFIDFSLSEFTESF